jgi:hypothetical protein
MRALESQTIPVTASVFTGYLYHVTTAGPSFCAVTVTAPVDKVVEIFDTLVHRTVERYTTNIIACYMPIILENLLWLLGKTLDTN